MGWQWGQGPWKCFPHVQVSDVLCYKPIPITFVQPKISYVEKKSIEVPISKTRIKKKKKGDNS